MAKAPAMRPTGESVGDLIAGIRVAQRREDAQILCDLMQDVTGDEPEVWASKIVGFGRYHYRYDSGREGEVPLVGFAPQASQFAVYLISDFEERHAQELSRLGPYRAGKACLYLKRLADVDLEVLRTLIELTVRESREAELDRDA